MKTPHQYLILDPLAFITSTIRLSIESIILSIFSEGKSIIILLTLPENCSKDSLCIHLDMVPFFSFMLIRWKKFSMALGLGCVAGLQKSLPQSHPKLYKPLQGFDLGHHPEGSVLSLQSSCAILANFRPLIRLWYCVHIIAPFP